MQNLLSAITKSDFNAIVAPLLEVCKAVTPVLLTVVGSLGAIWCIVLGVKYVTGDDPQEHEKAKKSLINSIVGYVLIFVLLLALQVATTKLSTWYSTYQG